MAKCLVRRLYFSQICFIGIGYCYIIVGGVGVFVVSVGASFNFGLLFYFFHFFIIVFFFFVLVCLVSGIVSERIITTLSHCRHLRYKRTTDKWTWVSSRELDVCFLSFLRLLHCIIIQNLLFAHAFHRI